MNEKSQDFDIDNIYHFFFDDTDLHPKAEAEIGWFLRNSDEAKVINELTFKLDELLKTLGDVTTQKFTNDCGWHDVVEKTKDALKLIAERDKGQIRCRAR